MQMRVRQRFDDLRKADDGRIPWHVIDASKSVSDVTSDIVAIAEKVVAESGDKPIQELWVDAENTTT